MRINRYILGLLLVLALGAAVIGNARPVFQQSQPTPATETKPVYYCNAPTKKGTACRHRVKKAGDRCWQHKEAK